MSKLSWVTAGAHHGLLVTVTPNFCRAAKAFNLYPNERDSGDSVKQAREKTTTAKNKHVKLTTRFQ